MAAHGTHAYAQAIHRNGFYAAEDLVGFGHALPLFFGLPIVKLLVDPGNKGARQRRTEVGRGQ